MSSRIPLQSSTRIKFNFTSSILFLCRNDRARLAPCILHASLVKKMSFSIVVLDIGSEQDAMSVRIVDAQLAFVAIVNVGAGEGEDEPPRVG